MFTYKVVLVGSGRSLHAEKGGRPGTMYPTTHQLPIVMPLSIERILVWVVVASHHTTFTTLPPTWTSARQSVEVYMRFLELDCPSSNCQIRA